MAIKFCKICSSLLHEKIKDGNKLEFHCNNCNEPFPAELTDTLTSVVIYGEKSTINEAVVDNASRIHAPNRQSGQCPKCKSPFMTKIYFDDLVPMYVCGCGMRANHAEFSKFPKVLKT